MFKDKENGKTTVVVGTWNKEEHSEWAQKNVARAYHLKDDGAQTVKYVNFICAFQHNMESVVSVGRSVGRSVCIQEWGKGEKMHEREPSGTRPFLDRFSACFIFC